MEQKDKKNAPRNKKNNSWRGMVSLVCWALLLTTIISYAGNYVTSAGNRASNVEVDYSEFTEMVSSLAVESVDFDSNEAILLITPKDGYIYTDEDGVEYTKSTDEDGYAVYTYVNERGKTDTVGLQLFTV